MIWRMARSQPPQLAPAPQPRATWPTVLAPAWTVLRTVRSETPLHWHTIMISWTPRSLQRVDRASPSSLNDFEKQCRFRKKCSTGPPHAKKRCTPRGCLFAGLYGGGDRIRTGDQGFAGPRLTTWLRRHPTSRPRDRSSRFDGPRGKRNEGVNKPAAGSQSPPAIGRVNSSGRGNLSPPKITHMPPSSASTTAPNKSAWAD